jgi:hypothetical protein
MLRRIGLILKRIALLAVVGLLVCGFLASGLSVKREPVTGLTVAPVANVVTAVGKHADLAEEAPQVEAAEMRPEGWAGQADSTKQADSTSQAEEAAVRRAVDQLDQTLAESWQAAGIGIAPTADWMTVGRRLSLALVGTGMPLEDFRRLESLPEDRRLDVYLEWLLHDSRHHDYWGERFTRAFVGAEDGPFITFRRRRFRLWLSDAIAANRPWDQLIRDLVTARGLATDRPEVNFLTVTMNSSEQDQPNPIRLAAKVSRAMLGLRIDCLQCHDDFLGNVTLGEPDRLRRGTQHDFHGLAAFFSPARFNGLQGIRDTEHPYRYRYLDAEEEVEVEPMVPWGQDWLPANGTDRERLAAWLTHPENRQVSLSLASRIWALMFGRPAGETVDDLPLDRPPPPAISVLADELVRSGYDIRHLIRVIARSRAFRLDSAADFEVTAEHENLGSVFPLVRLRPEQVAASVIQASRVKAIDRDSALIVQFQKFIGTNDFLERYGDSGDDEFDQQPTTIPQRLMMLNGELVREQGRREAILNATTHINLFSLSDRAAIDSIYLAVLNRYPDDSERQVFEARLVEPSLEGENPPDPSSGIATPTAGDRRSVRFTSPTSTMRRERLIEDLFWVLINSSEFAWNH